MNKEDISTSILSGLGLTVSITDFKNWLDIVLIALSIINILIIMFFKFRKYVSDKKLDEDELKDLEDDFRKLNNKIKELEEGRNEQY